MNRRRRGRYCPMSGVQHATATVAVWHMPMTPAYSIDVSQLTWAEKERVLRVLFAKMNAVALERTSSRSENRASKSHRSFPSHHKSPSVRYRQQAAASDCSSTSLKWRSKPRRATGIGVVVNICICSATQRRMVLIHALRTGASVVKPYKTTKQIETP